MKNILYLVFALLMLSGCEKETLSPIGSETDESVNFNANLNRVEICHFTEGTNSWETISISPNAFASHVGHGDLLSGSWSGFFFLFNREIELIFNFDCANPNLQIAGSLCLPRPIRWTQGLDGSLIVSADQYVLICNIPQFFSLRFTEDGRLEAEYIRVGYEQTVYLTKIK